MRDSQCVVIGFMASSSPRAGSPAYLTRVSRPITMALNTSILLVSGGTCDDNAKEKQFLNAINDESRVAGNAKPDHRHPVKTTFNGSLLPLLSSSGVSSLASFKYGLVH